MIFLIRHGQTHLNRSGLLQGRSDMPLNEDGIRQAEEAARYFSGMTFSHVFSSPLKRAVQTARIIAKDLPVRTDSRLIEMDYGPYEGSDLSSPSEELKQFFSDFAHNPAPKGMEPLDSVTARMGSFLEELRMLEGNILVSTHAVALKGALTYLTGDHGWWSRYIGNCAVFQTEYQNGRFSLPRELNNRKR